MTAKRWEDLPVPEGEIRRAADIILDGGIVCIPTESSYGLAVDPRSEPALARLTEIKARPAGMPVALIAADAIQAKRVSSAWPDVAQRLADRFWPGPLTLVVPPIDTLGPEVASPKGVGVRVSSHPWARALANAAGFAITATSANPSGSPPSTTAQMAQSYFAAAIDCYLDDGLEHYGQPSTILAIDVSGEIEELRAGPVAWREV